MIGVLFIVLLYILFGMCHVIFSFHGNHWIGTILVVSDYVEGICKWAMTSLSGKLYYTLKRSKNMQSLFALNLISNYPHLQALPIDHDASLVWLDASSALHLPKYLNNPCIALL